MKTLEVAMSSKLKDVDPEIYQAIKSEVKRQNENIELIASENFVSEAVLEAQGSVLTNKYAEGYPGKRWYGGCEFVDIAESLAIERAKKLFGAEHANVQPHSGTQANMAVYLAMLNIGDTMLAMNLAHGGHLTHGHPMNFSGKYYKIVPYGVSEKTEQIDYDELAKLARENKPKLILMGASAYPRIIDFKRAKQLFGAEHANVQPHSGTQANMAVYLAMLNIGDTVLAMNLAHGGHLTHGHPMNFSGKYYKIIIYSTCWAGYRFVSICFTRKSH